MSRGFDGFDIDDFRDPQWESERYHPGRVSSQKRGSGSQSGGTVRSKLESLLHRLDAHPKIYIFRFQVLCICRGHFFLFSLSAWWKYFARISTSYRTRPTDDAAEANVDLTH